MHIQHLDPRHINYFYVCSGLFPSDFPSAYWGPFAFSVNKAVFLSTCANTAKDLKLYEAPITSVFTIACETGMGSIYVILYLFFNVYFLALVCSGCISGPVYGSSVGCNATGINPPNTVFAMESSLCRSGIVLCLD